MNNNYGPPPTSGGLMIPNGESERERRLRLRELERKRRNENQGAQGLSYGAAQIAPPQIVKPQESLGLPIQQNQMQNFTPIEPQYHPVNLSHLQKQVEAVKAAYEPQSSLNDRDKDFFMQHLSPNVGIDTRDHPMRKSSKSKLNIEQAKQLDGHLQIGNNQLDDHRRELDKLQRQQDYQQFLAKQNQQKSPSKLIEKLNSARQFSQQVAPQQPQFVMPQFSGLPPPGSSPNKQNRNLVQRSNSIHHNQHPPSFNILGQPVQKLQGRSGSISGMAPIDQEPLIQGGLSQIGDAQSKTQEEKLRQQREYREYLDMQKNQANSAKPTSAPSGKPPSSGNFIAQSKSVRDEAYLQERRKQIGDEIFNQMMASRPGSSHGGPPPMGMPSQMQMGSPMMGMPPQMPYSQMGMPPKQIPPQFQPQTPPQNPLPDIRRSQSQSGRDDFFKNQHVSEQDQKKQEQDRKREYAMELQQQMNQKKQQLPPKIPTKPMTQSLDINNIQDDPRYQEILKQKREEYKMQLDEQMRQKEPKFEQQKFIQAPPQFQNREFGGPQMPFEMTPGLNQGPPFSQGPPSGFIQGPPGFNQGPPPGFNQGPPPGFNQGPPPSFNQGPPPGFDRGPLLGFNPGPSPSSFSQGPPPGLSKPQQDQGISPFLQGPDESDLRRQKIEEYRRELDAQMRAKDPLPKAVPDRAYSEAVINHALPGQDDKSQQYNVGLRNRSDITKRPESASDIRKKQAYQEELRQQMEEAKAKKEIEKQRKKMEDQEFERQIEMDRERIESRQKEELKKEGKKVDDDRPKKKVNLQQFQTSDQIQAEKDREKEIGFRLKEGFNSGPQESGFNPLSKFDQGPPQREFNPITRFDQGPSRDFNPPPREFNEFNPPPRDFNLPPREFNPPPREFNPAPREFNPAPREFNPVPPRDFNPLPRDLPLHRDFNPVAPSHYNPLPNPMPQTAGFGPPGDLPIQQHQKLLDDQRQMLEMYQQALQQILDFRNQCFKEAMGMQINLMKEREQMFQMQQQQQLPMPNLFSLPGGQSLEDYQKQAKEIQQLQAVKQQIGTLIENQKGGITPIINPQVQNNLNTLIKSQRDQIVRMSQSMNFRQQQSPERNINFDQSLSSNSKLISVPNQFTNKLKQKADGFEQQRLLNQSPVTSPKSHMQPPQTSATKSGLYQTWKIHGDPSQTSLNERADRSISPRKANHMQASLIGSSQLQFINQSGNPGPIGDTQERMFSPIPQRNQVPGVSPGRFQRPQTNLLPNEPIQELPEKEQNLDNTNDYDDETMEQVIKKQQENQRAMHMTKIKQSIETDNDFNNRDEDMTQYSKSIHGRKSKVSQGKISTQIEQNLNFIEKQVNLVHGGRNYNGINSNSKEPFKSELQQERKSGILLSPGAQSNQMINIGQALQSAGHNNRGQKPVIPTSTEKSFYKPANLNQSNFGNTGMQGAPRPSQTGSSFYNATMAKTKQQELNQQEEYQRQLLKIFSPDNEDPKHYEHLNNTEDIENMSNINIAQSIVNSIDVKDYNRNQHYGEDEFHLQQTNGVINEQEFESKSRSVEESGSNQQTIRQQEVDIQSQTQRTNKPQGPPQGSRGGQEGPIWDDPDLIPSYYDEQEGDDDQGVDFQFDGTNASNQNFEVIQETEKQYNPLVYQSRDQQPWLKPGTAQPYDKESFKQSNYNFNEESSYNIAASVENDSKIYDRPASKSGISNLHLGHGIFSEEPQTALIVKNDSTLNRLQKCSPSQNNLQSLTTPEEKKQIDDMYEMRESLQQFKKQAPQIIVREETSDIYPPQKRPVEIHKNNQVFQKKKDSILESTTPVSPEQKVVADKLKETSEFAQPEMEEESLQEKLDKIKNIFSETPAESKPITTPRNQQASNIPDQFSVMRPRTMDKQKELEELAKLIQAATEGVGQVVETSYQLPPFKMRRERKQLEKAIQEDNENDNQILSDLDQIINNLEQQQKQSERIQHKFSSNLQYQLPRDDDIAEDYMTQNNDAQAYLSDKVSEDLKETIQVERKGQIIKRPISSNSMSTNRYGQTQKKMEKYEQFDSDEERPETVQTQQL